MTSLIVNEFVKMDLRNARARLEPEWGNSLKDDDIKMLETPYPVIRPDEKSFPGLWIEFSESRLSENRIDTLADYDRLVAEKAVNLYFDFANRNFGIFSLSTAQTDGMWAYYADNQKGIRVDFDSSHSYFFQKVKALNYSSERVSVSINHGRVRLGGNLYATADILNGKLVQIPEELLLEKTSSWKHEKEHRHILPLMNAKSCVGVDDLGFDILLFEIPAESIVSITFGLRAGSERIRMTIEACKYRLGWRNLKFYKREQLGSLITEKELIGY